MHAINSTAPPFLRRWGSRFSRLAQARRTRRLLIESLENRSLLALVSWWTADSTAVDLVAGKNGTLINGATYAAGRFSEAFSFDGIDDRIGIADSPRFKL